MSQDHNCDVIHSFDRSVVELPFSKQEIVCLYGYAAFQFVKID